MRQKAPEAESILYTHLKEADYVIRETAAELIGQTKPAGGLAALREAYAAGQPDAAYSARAAAVSAMAAYGADGAEGRASGAGRQGLGGAGPGGGAAHEARSVRRSPVGDPAGAGLTDLPATTIRS